MSGATWLRLSKGPTRPCCFTSRISQVRGHDSFPAPSTLIAALNECFVCGYTSGRHNMLSQYGPASVAVCDWRYSGLSLCLTSKCLFMLSATVHVLTYVVPSYDIQILDHISLLWSLTTIRFQSLLLKLTFLSGSKTPPLIQHA